jgi:hypothetical protein
MSEVANAYDASLGGVAIQGQIQNARPRDSWIATSRKGLRWRQAYNSV